jgi:hypothetical protein
MTRKRQVEVGAAMLVVVLLLGWFWLIGPTGGQDPAVGSSYSVLITPERYKATKDLTGRELQDALGITTLSWTPQEVIVDGESVTDAVISAPPGSERLSGCPEVLRPLQILLPDGRAFCIEGASSNPDADWMASDVVIRMTQERVPSLTELKLMQVHSRMAFTDPESSAMDELQALEDRLRDSLTDSEQAAIDAGYDALRA